MNFGIDAISFYTANYYLDLKDFALARNESVAKFYEDLGQRKMSIIPPGEDLVTLAANAAWPLLAGQNNDEIEMVIFATESSSDLSKSAATYIHKLFHLSKRCRVIEFKQACYSATFGLQLGLAWLRQYPNKKILLLASDIASYKFNTQAESSQGCGAVAMLLTADPRLLIIDPVSGFCTKEAMDFWRPSYCDFALVDGRLSCDLYLRLAEETWQQYLELSGRKFSDHDRFCYHVPVPKLVERAHRRIAKTSGINLTSEQFEYQIGSSLLYNREVGNCYTASLYLSVLSLLENITADLAGKLLALYSYGSGSIAEFFAARVAPSYQKYLHRAAHQQLLAARNKLSFAEYEEFYRFKLPTDGSLFKLPLCYHTGNFRLKELSEHQRIYERLA